MPRRFLPPIFPQGVPPGDYLDATTTLTQGVGEHNIELSSAAASASLNRRLGRSLANPGEIQGDCFSDLLGITSLFDAAFGPTKAQVGS